jgi:phosphoribosylanthranilate isomerase
MLQFHGGESADYCRSFKGHKVIKAIPVADGLDLKGLSAWRGCGLLFDTCSKGAFGGTGKKFNWHLLGNPDKIKGTVFISGGLTCANVGKAVKMFRPDWGMLQLLDQVREEGPKKIERFIRAASRGRA